VNPTLKNPKQCFLEANISTAYMLVWSRITANSPGKKNRMVLCATAFRKQMR